MFLPVISVNGGTPVDWWGVVRAAVSTRGSLISQSFLLADTYFFNMLTTVRLACSTWPEEIGWCLYGAWPVYLGVSTLPAWLWRWSGFLGQSWPLKIVRNLEEMWFINRQAVVSAISLGAGRHSIHFVNSQTTVRKYLLPCVTVLTVAGVLLRFDHGKVIPFLCSGARWFGFAGWN